jgi:hypothetical protein
MRKKQPTRRPPQDYRDLDPNGGYLCITVHWKPDPNQPTAQMPGQKQNLFAYIPAKPQDRCLCGSGKAYADCCRVRPYWYPICPDPDWDGTNYSLISMELATFQGVNGPALYERLMQLVHLHCTEDIPDRGFWIYWGNPALKDSWGIVCFGDFELLNMTRTPQDCTLVVTAMSELRLEYLLSFLREVAGDLLIAPVIKSKPVEIFDKNGMKKCSVLTPRRD